MCAASVIWGIGYPFWKILSKELDVLSLTSMSFIITSVALFLIDKHKVSDLIVNFKKSPLLIVMLGLSAGILGTGLFFIALERLDSGIVAFLEKLQAVSVLICAKIFLKEKFPLSKVPLVFLTLFLALLLTIENPLKIDLAKLDLIGILAGFSCAIFYGANVVMYKILDQKGIPSSDIVFFRMFVGGLLIVPILLFKENAIETIIKIAPAHLFLLITLCLICQAAAFKLFVSGLKHTTAATSGFIELLTPVVAMLVGVNFFGEKLSPQQLLIIPFYIASIILLTIPKKMSNDGSALTNGTDGYSSV